jgi:hypothetical protein
MPSYITATGSSSTEMITVGVSLGMIDENIAYIK